MSSIKQKNLYLRLNVAERPENTELESYKSSSLLYNTEENLLLRSCCSSASSKLQELLGAGISNSDEKGLLLDLLLHFFILSFEICYDNLLNLKV